jgi:hypothetical protein
MGDFISNLTISTLIIGILVLAAIFFIRRILGKEKGFSLTLLLLILLCGAAFLYLDSKDMGKMTLSEFKEIMFPPDIPSSYSYKIEEGHHRGRPFTRYVFNKPMPRLTLVMDPTGKFFVMKNIKPLNRVLSYIGLPRVSEGKPELNSITGKNSDVYSFQWDSYAGGGTLLVERTICDEEVELGTPHCLSSITYLR